MEPASSQIHFLLASAPAAAPAGRSSWRPGSQSVGWPDISIKDEIYICELAASRSGGVGVWTSGPAITESWWDYNFCAGGFCESGWVEDSGAQELSPARVKWSYSLL